MSLRRLLLLYVVVTLAIAVPWALACAVLALPAEVALLVGMVLGATAPIFWAALVRRLERR